MKLAFSALLFVGSGITCFVGALTQDASVWISGVLGLLLGGFLLFREIWKI